MKAKDIFYSILVPDYKEINLFQFGIVFLFLFITNSDLRSHFAIVEMNSMYDLTLNILKLLSLSIFFIGSIMSIINALTFREKTRTNKRIVLCFIVFINFFIAVVTIKYLQNKHNDLLMIFPGLNLLHAGCIVFLWRMRLIRIDSISDDDATLSQVLLSFFIIIALLVAMQYYLNHYWAITFTFSITYSVIFNNNIVALIESLKYINSKSIGINK